MLRYLVLFLYQFAILCHCHELDNTVSNFNVFSASSKSILGLNRTLSLTRPARAISLADVLLISNFREMAIYGLSERALPEYFTYDFPTTVEGSVATTIDEGLAVIGVQGLQKVAFISGAANSSFGHAVAKSGSTLLVSQLSSKEVLVHEQVSSDEWVVTQVLSEFVDSYGQAAAVSGSISLVSAPNQGKVFCYVRRSNTWKLSSVITSPAAVTSGSFGANVAVSGIYSAISDNNYVYVFKFVEEVWVLLSSLKCDAVVQSMTLFRDTLMIQSSLTNVQVYVLNQEV